VSAKLSSDTRSARLAAAEYRIVSTPNLVDEFADLLVKLSEIKETIADESEQAEQMLMQFCAFLKPVVEQPSPLTPLFKLIHALRDNREGHEVSTVFQPRKKQRGGPTPKGSIVQEVWGVAARACTCLAETPTITVPEAAERVAKAVRDFPGLKKTSGRTVMGWRAKCMIGEGGMSDIALAHYRMPLDDWFDALSPEQQGEELIAAIRRAAKIST
jgi:hypothetical protein